MTPVGSSNPGGGGRAESGRPTVTIVGAGFSGLLTALHLVSDPDGPCVRLHERAAPFGRGLAYRTRDRAHLVNVRAANMSAFPDAPDHFVRWLAAQGDGDCDGAFATRRTYGDYLQDLLRLAVESHPARLLLEFDEVVDLHPVGGRWRVDTAMGRSLWSDGVVLATGLPSPSPLPGAEPALLASPRYIGNPWGADLVEAELGDNLLLLGTGLTMVDAALTLSRPHRRLTAISRRGLSPHSHAAQRPPPQDLTIEGSPLQALQAIRALARTADWREVIDRTRGSATPLWAAWSTAQRRQFLRHLRPWWDVRRHRMAPPVARRIEGMRRTGELTIRAGALQRLSLEEAAVRVHWRPRGEERLQTAVFDTVINCTGQGGDIAHAGQPLLAALMRRGLIRPDPCRLGVDVDAHSRPLDRPGAAAQSFFAVGPLTRGAFWEMTAVPDLRRQAADVAGRLAASLRGTRLLACH